MFRILNDVLGKSVLVALFGAVIIFALSGACEFGTVWNQGQKDVEEYQRQADERPVVGLIKGEAYYSEEEFAQDYEELMTSSWQD